MEDTTVYALCALSAAVQLTAVVVTVLVLKRAKNIERIKRDEVCSEPAASGLERRMNELQRMKFSYMGKEVKIKRTEE